jgi:hypothetical protein
LGFPNSVCLLQQTQTNISTGSFRSQVKRSLASPFLFNP